MERAARIRQQQQNPLWGYFFLALILALAGWAFFTWARSAHLFAFAGYTLPAIHTESQVWQGARHAPAGLRVSDCRRQGWRHDLTCNVSAAVPVPGITFESYQFSKAGPVKIQDGRADMPALEPGQAGRLTLRLQNMRDADSLFLRIASR